MQDSIARQKASVAKQAGAPDKDGFFTTDWIGPALLPPPPPDCPAMAETQVDPLIAAAATAQKLKPELLKAVIRVESAFRPCAVSAKGAMGLMQIMPETADKFQVADPFDPGRNIDAGARYLKQLLDRYPGDLKRALAAYNAGPARVDGNQPAVPDIQETQDYVKEILQALEPARPPDKSP